MQALAAFPSSQVSSTDNTPFYIVSLTDNESLTENVGSDVSSAVMMNPGIDHPRSLLGLKNLADTRICISCKLMYCCGIVN